MCAIISPVELHLNLKRVQVLSEVLKPPKKKPRRCVTAVKTRIISEV